MAAVSMAALLLLADGRFPAGGHAHSAGVEAAVADGRVTDVASLAAFTEGRLRTTGLVDAAVAMATAARFGPAWGGGGVDGGRACMGPAEASELLCRLDAEVDARIPSLPLRAASRRLGRQLLRVAARCWPSPLLALAINPAVDAHHAVALGLCGVAGGLNVDEVGHLSTHHAVTTPMQAGVRLLGLDPFAAAAATAGLAEVAAAVVGQAGSFAAGPLEDLPARSAPLVEMASIGHATADGRLFVT